MLIILRGTKVARYVNYGDPITSRHCQSMRDIVLFTRKFEGNVPKMDHLESNMAGMVLSMDVRFNMCMRY